MLPIEFKQVFRVTSETFVTYATNLCYFVMNVVKFKYKKSTRTVFISWPSQLYPSKFPRNPTFGNF